MVARRLRARRCWLQVLRGVAPLRAPLQPVGVPVPDQQVAALRRVVDSPVRMGGLWPERAQRVVAQRQVAARVVAVRQVARSGVMPVVAPPFEPRQPHTKIPKKQKKLGSKPLACVA